MGDMGEDFKFMTAFKKKKKKASFETSMRKLKENDIEYESLNGGFHLKISTSDKIIDFYPSTQLWMVKGSKMKRRGVTPLIQFILKQRVK